MSEELAMARTGLLDALGALKAHLDALILVGAQAIYLHTGPMDIALAEFTTDGDVAVDPDLLSSEPLIEEALQAADFTPDPRVDAIGSWLSPSGVYVDLMVPAAVAGPGRRGARLAPHDSRAMRKSRGLEATLVDKSKRTVPAYDPAQDPREFEIAVAGPGSLLIAKMHKLNDRVGVPSRRSNKDAHDVYRLLRAVDTPDLADTISRLQCESVSAKVTHDALAHLRELFAAGPGAQGSAMAGAAEELVGDPTAVSESVTLLAQDLLDALNS